MKKYKHPPSFKFSEDALASEFSAWKMLHIFPSIILYQQGLSFREIDSAIFPIFLRTREKDAAAIINMQWLGVKMVRKIMRKVENEI